MKRKELSRKVKISVTKTIEGSWRRPEKRPNARLFRALYSPTFIPYATLEFRRVGCDNGQNDPG
jgi:hypothetical protein